MNRYEFRQLDSTKSPLAGGDVISRCGALLENRMQCTRAGEYEVKDAAAPDKLIQVCKRHAVIMEAEGKNWEPSKEELPSGAQPAVEQNTPPVDTPPTPPKTVAEVLSQGTLAPQATNSGNKTN